MFTSWVLIVMLVVSLVILLMALVCWWKRIPSILRWFSGLNALILLVNIMSLGLTIEQQNAVGVTNPYHTEQVGSVGSNKESNILIDPSKDKDTEGLKIFE